MLRFFSGTSFLIFGLVFSTIVSAADIKCDVCGMKFAEHAKDEVVLTSSNGAKVMHTCSLTCAHKARKYDAKFSKVQVTDFNHPDISIAGDRAFYIMSRHLKLDVGDATMPPYFAAFATRAEAEMAQKKYDQTEIYEGFEALEKYKISKENLK